MPITKEKFELAKKVAIDVSRATDGVPMSVKHFGIALFVASEISIVARSREEAERMLSGFIEGAQIELEGALQKTGRA